MSTASTDFSDSLRAEAGTQLLHELTESQQDAVAELIGRLHVTLSEISKSTCPESSSIDRSRRTRLQFWSGEPGVGKTSAYLSVRDWYVTDNDSKVIDDKLRETLRVQRRRGPSKRVRWLEPLDLEPLSGCPNFLAAVAVRIDQALGLQTGEDLDTWLQPGGSEFRKVEEEFQQLKNDIALSWEGNLLARGVALDPDVYAAEVLRAERARLNVNLKFSSVVSRLAKHAPGRTNEGPLIFVLPIDDYYLKPDMTLELLRLLRMISCPHLFVLMMGDIDNVEELAFCHSLGEVSRLMGNGVGMLTKSIRSRILRRTDVLASVALHKLIPVNQQFKLLSMLHKETLRFCPRGASRPIGKLLQDAGFGGVMGLSADGLDTELWFIQNAFELSPRHASDLYRALEELIAKGEKDRPRFVADQVERTLFESLESKVADRVLREMNDYFDYFRRKFPSDAVKAEAYERPSSASTSRLFKFVLIGENGNRSKIPLQPRVRGWLAILYDTLVDAFSSEIEPLPLLSEVGFARFAEYARSNPGSNRKAEADDTEKSPAGVVGNPSSKRTGKRAAKPVTHSSANVPKK